MNIVFLDIDGVLVTYRSMDLRPVRRDRWVLHKFQKSCVNALNRLTRKTKASIVVSSTWRFRPWDLLVQHMRQQGVTGEIIGKTVTERMPRGQQIDLWLKSNPFVAPGELVSFVILDDDSDMEPHLGRLIQPTAALGLQQKHVDLAIDLFRQTPNEPIT